MPRCCAAPTAARTCRCAAPCRPAPTTWGCTSCTCPCPTTPASRRPSSSPRVEGAAMIEAYDVAGVRAAEGAAMRELPEGTLMDRAARGLASVVGVRLRERGGRRVVALVGGGDNGGDALYAVAALAEDGVAAAVVTVSEHPHPAGLDAVTAAGVEVVASLGARADPRAVELVQEADVVLDGILGIGGRPGPAPPAGAGGRAGPRRPLGGAGRPPGGARPRGGGVPPPPGG